jgi:alkylated DNA repair dioxygenase AlkB
MSAQNERKRCVETRGDDDDLLDDSKRQRTSAFDVLMNRANTTTTSDDDNGYLVNQSRVFEEGPSWVDSAMLERSRIWSSETFDRVWQSKPDGRATFIMFGKPVLSPRFQQVYGDRSYSFGGNTHAPVCLDTLPELQPLLEIANRHWHEHDLRAKQSGLELNGAVVNWYDGGAQYIGMHSDKTSELAPSSPIYSFTFGETRDFRISAKQGCEKSITLPLANGQMVVMGGDMQRTHKHGVPKRKRSKGRRINVTLRCFA